MNKELILIVAAVALLVFLVFLAIFLAFLRLWIQALLTGVRISIMELIAMKLRRTPPELIVRTAIALKQRGVEAGVVEIEACYFASGGEVTDPIQLATLVLEQRNKPRERTTTAEERR